MRWEERLGEEKAGPGAGGQGRLSWKGASAETGGAESTPADFRSAQGPPKDRRNPADPCCAEVRALGG